MSDPIFLYKEYILAIDTDRYAFDFLRNLVAYCTGYSYESSISTEYSDIFYNDLEIDGLAKEEKNPFYGYIIDREDELGALSPCCLLLNKKYGINDSGGYAVLDQDNFDQYSSPAPFSVGIFFDQEPLSEQIYLIKNRARNFFKKIWKSDAVNIEGFRLIIHSKYAEEVLLD
jgi:hypothetical protein